MLILAHRGAPGSGVAENSLLALSNASALGADGVEVDVRLSADGKLVLCHDRNVRDGRLLSALSKEELERALGHSVLELSDGLDALPELYWNLELKDRSVVPRVRRLLQQLRSSMRVLITSFDHAAAIACTDGTPFAAGFLISHLPNSSDRLPLPSGNARFLVWDAEFISSEMLHASRDVGWENMSYGIVSPDEIGTASQDTLAGVITDYPAKFS